MNALWLLALAAGSELWAGHAIVAGKRAVPFLGKVEAKTESWVLARVERTPNGFRLEQQSCRVELSNPLGVDLKMNPGAAEKLPPLIIEYVKRPDGKYYQAPSVSGWAEEDVDKDGKPGMTVNVEAPICGGKLFVGLKTKSMSRGELSADGVMRGEIKAQVAQKVIGTEGACLGVLSNDADDPAGGNFAYVPTSSVATCASLTAASRWPVLASPESKKIIQSLPAR